MRITTIAGLASAVRARRRELSLSQSALAERSGVSRAWIGRLEAGAPNAEIGRLLRVLDALRLDLTLSGDGERPKGESEPGDVDLDALLEAYRDTPA